MKRIFPLAFGAILVAVMAMMYFQQASVAKELPVLGRIGDIDLVNQQEANFNRDALKDKVWVANFIFTSCRGICPMMTKNMSEVHKAFATDQVQFVSISVDPETDTPARLRSYRKKMHVDEAQNWHFLTGEREKIKNLMKNDFKLIFKEQAIMHSDRMVLVDAQNRIRGYYEGTNKKEYQKLMKDMASLLK